MAHLLKPGQSKLTCYLTGALIGAIIAFILATLLSENGRITGSAFYDIQIGSILTVLIYAILSGDAGKQIKKADGNYAVWILPLIAIAGLAPLVNLLVGIPIVLVIASFPAVSFSDIVSEVQFSGLAFAYGGSNMLGFWFLYKNEPSKYDK